MSILIVSEDFSKELTTSVLWLNQNNLDIRCVRVQPYHSPDRLIVDVQQIIPLPQAETYTTALKEKQSKRKEQRIQAEGDASHQKKFWAQLVQKAELTGNPDILAGSCPRHWIGKKFIHSNAKLVYKVRKKHSRIELYIDKGADSKVINKQIFDFLFERKSQIENVFGGPLNWRRMDTDTASIIEKRYKLGGLRNRDQWDAMQQAMVEDMDKLSKALRPVLQQFKPKATS